MAEQEKTEGSGADAEAFVVAAQAVHDMNMAGAVPIGDEMRITINPILLEAMKKIAHGRTDQGGRALGGETAREMMRRAMAACGLDW